MLSAEGCRQRRQRVLEALQPAEPLVFADPLHLRYLANFHSEPFSLGADFAGILILNPDGSTRLIHDNRIAAAGPIHVDQTEVLKWYDGQTPGAGPRRLRLRDAAGGRIHDAMMDPDAERIISTISELRRVKDADELAVLRACMAATAAGHAWARLQVEPGMTELEAYLGIAQACMQAAGQAVIVYGDFIVCTGPNRRVGPPTDRVLRPGDLFIVDFSVIRHGYRSDFTNTLAIGAEPTAEQVRMFEHCTRALSAAESQLRAGVSCQQIYDAVRDTFAAAEMAEHFPHHAGHGLGLSHPEAPYFVRASTETLCAGDVVTIEPGLYVEGIGGMRIEHNYHITASGYERLSDHIIALTVDGL